MPVRNRQVIGSQQILNQNCEKLQIEPVSKDVPDSPRPSEGSIYKSLTPQEEVLHNSLMS